MRAARQAACKGGGARGEWTSRVARCVSNLVSARQGSGPRQGTALLPMHLLPPTVHSYVRFRHSQSVDVALHPLLPVVYYKRWLGMICEVVRSRDLSQKHSYDNHAAADSIWLHRSLAPVSC
jgi:hypothetical protein